jgi:cellulose synthase/poly-beta-1,6-N-acetylglucosamine synthase-like glycosyltransferase
MIVAAQNFEYKMSGILDKPTESLFGFISVLVRESLLVLRLFVHKKQGSLGHFLRTGTVGFYWWSLQYCLTGTL